MSYSTMKNVTPIEMLPELEDLEGSSVQGNITKPFFQKGNMYTEGHESQIIPNSEKERVSRYVRNGHVLHPDSGMNPYIESNPRPDPHMRSYEQPMHQEVFISNNSRPSGPTCIEVADHIANCPICSKFYNNDKTIYIIAIIMLAIVCILLLKRVLDI